ncbi:MAG: endonuclease Q family protein [Candidatus Omnitrophota bacterium]
MKFYADVHLHSYYSRATSKNLNLEYLNLWGQLKGIQVIGTGDFTHPAWFEELKKKLEPAEEGLFRLKKEFRDVTRDELPKACAGDVRFMLTVEISNIYKRLDKVRKVHNCVFAPSFEAADKIRQRLGKIGNLRSDGRPILGLDSRDLLEIVLESDPLSYLIPAHIWTPWFSALGSKGGFDRMEDCFGDLTEHIFALETGLSSDPLMNWRLSQLDPYVLVSNGDAHSPQKLGREATIYNTDLSYPAIYNALKNHRTDKGLAGTIEFFPEEGKYHYDGHRLCKTRLHPRQTIENNGACPVCGKPVTVGVMARVEELADHPQGRKSPNARPFFSLVPLVEIIGEANDVGPGSKKVLMIYQEMLARLGNELFILLDCPLDEIRKAAGALLAEGIGRMRKGEVQIASGYDGEYGKIKIFSSQEKEQILEKEQLTLF